MLLFYFVLKNIYKSLVQGGKDWIVIVSSWSIDSVCNTYKPARHKVYIFLIYVKKTGPPQKSTHPFENTGFRPTLTCLNFFRKPSIYGKVLENAACKHFYISFLFLFKTKKILKSVDMLAFSYSKILFLAFLYMCTVILTMQNWETPGIQRLVILLFLNIPDLEFFKKILSRRLKIG